MNATPPIEKLLHEKNKYIVNFVSNLSVTQKRRIFAHLRNSQPIDHLNYIFPHLEAISLGEFCTSHILQTDTRRTKNKNNKKK